MKLHWSPRSPFVRKVMIALHETGLLGRVECVRSVADLATPNRALMADNPLAQIPTLVLDDGGVLYDSPVICEYLDSLHTGTRLIPPAGAARWSALRRQALADGLLDALLAWRHERQRPVDAQSAAYLASWALKLDATLAALDDDAGATQTDTFDIGHIAAGCLLSYLDFRFADVDWRGSHSRLRDWHARFELRPSVIATRIRNDE